MDVMTAAAELRKELVALHNSEVLVNRLDSEITCLGQRSLMSAMEDDQSRHLRLLLRLSVNEGVHHMYQQYATRKWAQVQNTAKSIKSILEADDTDLTHALMTSPVTSTPAGGSTSPDKAAEQWTAVFCELSRHE